MKKLIIASAFSLATFGVPAIAGATTASGCGDISNTGAGSTNQIDCNDNTDLTITCHNNVDVVFVNGQSSNSGSVTLNKNTNGGYAYSGNAVNTNSNTNTLDVSCGPVVAAITPTPAPTPTPAGGQGQGQVLGTTTKPVALPNTGSNPVSKAVVASVALIASGLAVISGVVPAAIRKLF